MQCFRKSTPRDYACYTYDVRLLHIILESNQEGSLGLPVSKNKDEPKKEQETRAIAKVLLKRLHNIYKGNFLNCIAMTRATL